MIPIGKVTVTGLHCLIVNLSFYRGTRMTIMKSTQILSDSSKSFEHAIANGVERFGKTVKHVRSASVSHMSVTVKSGAVEKYRVNMQVIFEVK